MSTDTISFDSCGFAFAFARKFASSKDSELLFGCCFLDGEELTSMFAKEAATFLDGVSNDCGLVDVVVDIVG